MINRPHEIARFNPFNHRLIPSFYCFIVALMHHSHFEDGDRLQVDTNLVLIFEATKPPPQKTTSLQVKNFGCAATLFCNVTVALIPIMFMDFL